jgi:hypothetical protein
MAQSGHFNRAERCLLSGLAGHVMKDISQDDAAGTSTIV